MSSTLIRLDEKLYQRLELKPPHNCGVIKKRISNDENAGERWEKQDLQLILHFTILKFKFSFIVLFFRNVALFEYQKK